MKIYQLPIEMVNALRSWFFAKDRSVLLADDTFIEGEETATPGSPAHNRGRLYWKNGYWTALNESGEEQILPGLVLISETVLSASAASVTFSGVPQIFRHLVLVGQIRSDRAAEVDATLMRFNNDTGGSYDREILTVNAATITSAATRAQTSIQIGTSEGATSRADNFSPVKVDILGYSRTDAEKWCFSEAGVFGNVSADADLFWLKIAGRWRNTTAIDSITVLPNVGPTFAIGCRFQLYGVQ